MTKQRAAAARRPAPGFSLLELLAALTVTSVLAAVAVPSFNRIAQDNRRASVANEVLATLLLARSRAAATGQFVIVCGLADSNGNGAIEPAERACSGRDWTDGWLLGVWTDANGDNRVDTAELTGVQEHVTGLRGKLTVHANSLAAAPPVAPAGTAVLKTFGRHSSNGTITICDRRGPAHARAVIMAANGRARISTRKADGTALSCP